VGDMRKEKNENPTDDNVSSVDTNDAKDEQRITRLVDYFTETMNLCKMVGTLINGIDYSEQNKYRGRLDWFLQRNIEFFQDEGLELITYERGFPYHTGLPVTALNESEFSAGDALIIDMVVEPALIFNDKIIKYGLVQLAMEEN